MESNLDHYEFPSEEQVEQMKEAMEQLQAFVLDLKRQYDEAERASKAETELRPDIYGEIANKNRKTKVRQFQARPLNKQAIITAQMLMLREKMKEYHDRIEDTLLVLNHRLFERAKIIHEALREASKTDPSLLEAVREMDELYQQAMEEEAEDDEA